ncbi:MAG TPA: hypothetical protein VJK02_15460 [Anaerolineales bacterium]|nr:hypothetical protein [Anaerolineales bacterium]
MKRSGLVALGAMALLILACSLPFAPTVEDRTEPSGVDSRGSSGGSATGERLLEDDFSDPASGWEVGEYEGGTVGYLSNIYQVESIGDGNVMWGVAGKVFDDVVIEVNATQFSAPDNDNNDYGVACRIQDEGAGYYLLISGDGYYSIMKAVGDERDPLVDWTESDVIIRGNGSNDIRGTCDGSSLTLEVNGQQLASATDSEFVSGDVALTATSYEDASTQIYFDDVRVRRP